MSIVYTVLYFRLLAIQEEISLDEVRNGVLAERKQAAIEAEAGEPGPWDHAGDPAMRVSHDSVGIPWSMFGSREALAAMQDALETPDEKRREDLEKHTEPRADGPL